MGKGQSWDVFGVKTPPPMPQHVSGAAFAHVGQRANASRAQGRDGKMQKLCISSRLPGLTHVSREEAC